MQFSLEFIDNLRFSLHLKKTMLAPNKEVLNVIFSSGFNTVLLVSS